MELDNQELQKVVTTMMCNRYNAVGQVVSIINKAIEIVCNDYGYDSELIYSQIIREIINEKDI